MSRDAALWTGILAGPIVWLISFETNFALVPWACIFQGKLALYLVSLVALVIAAGSGLLAWKQWSELGKEPEFEGAGALPRGRIMAFGGIMLSALSVLLIVGQAIGEIVLGACQ